MGQKQSAPAPVPEPVVPAIETMDDPTGWILESGIAEVLLLHTKEITYMAMFAYTYMHGYKLFPKLPENASIAYKFVSMIFQCTGGGILVPIFINKIPVPLAQDAYPLAIICSFLLHLYFPIMREVIGLSPILKAAIICLYEAQRAAVVTKLTKAAGAAIAPTEFGFPVFGPIFCGAIGGCGGAFLPLDKGLGPIKTDGLGQPMLSAFVGASFLHLFLNSSMSADVVDAKKKAQLALAVYFIAHNIYTTFFAGTGHKPAKAEPAKVEPAKVEPPAVAPTKVKPAKVEPAKVTPTKTSHATKPDPHHKADPHHKHTAPANHKVSHATKDSKKKN